jgi:hypothetical protein
MHAPHALGVQDTARERPRANHTHRLLQLTEGELTEKKKRYTRNAVLALAAQELGLPECLLVTGHPMSSPQGAAKLSADLLEAVIAALFLDQGIDQANRFCEAVLFLDRHQGGPLYAKPTDPALGTDICTSIHLVSCCPSLSSTHLNTHSHTHTHTRARKVLPWCVTRRERLRMWRAWSPSWGSPLAIRATCSR